jgi:ankyrin repeat protein
MRSLGLGAPGICGVILGDNVGELKNYLNQGGNLARDEDTRIASGDESLGSVGLPLSCALSSTNPDLAQLMISRIAGVNGVDEYGFSPLHWAVVSKSLTQELLAQGANVNVKSSYGFTPLHRAVGLINLQIQRDSDYSDVIKLLIDHGADINKADADGKTPLHLAVLALPYTAYFGKTSDIEQIIQLIQLFLNQGANANAVDQRGQTPLTLAVDKGNVAIAKLLLARGANVNAGKNWFGGTPLHSAVQNRNLEMIELLLQHGANVNIKDEHGSTPLKALPCQRYTIQNGQSVCQPSPNERQIIDLLKRYGAIQ